MWAYTISNKIERKEHIFMCFTGGTLIWRCWDTRWTGTWIKGGGAVWGGENTSRVNLMQNGVLNTMHQVA